MALKDKDEFASKRFKAFTGNDDMDLVAIRTPRYSDGAPVTTMMHPKTVPDSRARMAISCIERWGMVSGVHDGEDSAGRAKGRLATPAEVVVRACECAQTAYEEFTARGWLIPMPSYQGLVDTVKDQENGND